MECLSICSLVYISPGTSGEPRTGFGGRLSTEAKWYGLPANPLLCPIYPPYAAAYTHFVASLILQYSYLQVLDFLTTVAFLLAGVQEGNPLVRMAIAMAPSPLMGLALVKLAALSLGYYCFKVNREGLLTKIDILFAAIVAWNLVALIIAACQRPL